MHASCCWGSLEVTNFLTSCPSRLILVHLCRIPFTNQTPRYFRRESEEAPGGRRISWAARASTGHAASKPGRSWQKLGKQREAKLPLHAGSASAAIPSRPGHTSEQLSSGVRLIENRGVQGLLVQSACGSVHMSIHQRQNPRTLGSHFHSMLRSCLKDLEAP